MNRPKPRHSFLALFMLTLSMLAACFWPFEFHPHNDVRSVPGEPSLQFHGMGTAYSRDPFPSLRQLSERNELTVDMTVRPVRIFKTGLPYIFSFAPEKGQSALVIGAWRDSLVVRLGRPGNPGWKKYHEVGLDNVFAPGRTVHLVISLGPQGTAIFVDGLFRGSFAYAYPDTSDAPLGQFLLGNSPTGDYLWKGDILALALYARALTPAEIATGAAAGAHPVRMESDSRLIARYRFEKIHNKLVPNTSGPRYDIVIPAYFTPLRRTVLEPPREESRLTLRSLQDIVLNVAGFMPFGFLAMLSLGASTTISPRRQSLLVVLAGFTLSLFVEVTQAFLPTRNSTLTDLATNTVGSALGVLVFFIVVAWREGVIDQEGGHG